MLNGCGKPWRGEWTMMKLLTDRTLEIPPFLLRTPDGGFVYPDCAVPITAVVSASAAPDPLAEAIADANRRDAAVRGALMHAETISAKERSAEQAEARKAKKAAERERLAANKLKQREVFIQHFKWDHEQ
jgi:hypothetical protein